MEKNARCESRQSNTNMQSEKLQMKLCKAIFLKSTEVLFTSKEVQLSILEKCSLWYWIWLNYNRQSISNNTSYYFIQGKRVKYRLCNFTLSATYEAQDLRFN